MTTDDILESLFSPIKNYQREAMQAAADQWAEVGPALTALIGEKAGALRADPSSSDESMGLIYALTLFGHLRDRHAWPAVHALCTLPNGIADDELGGIATEDLSQVLYRCCGGNGDELAALYANRKVNQWVRGAAFRALQYGVADGVIARTVLLDCLIQTIGSQQDPDCDDRQLVEDARYDFLDMHPVEHADLAREWVDDEVLFPDDVGEDIDNLLTEMPEHWAKLLDGWRQDLKNYEPADLHERLEWWAAFEENKGRVHAPAARDAAFSPAVAAQVAMVKRIDAVQAAKRKQKNKMAKKSRQTNRKKK